MEGKVKKRINTFGKVAKIVTMVVIVFLLVAEGFLLVGGVIAAIVPKDSVTVDTGLDTRIDVNTDFFGLNGKQFFFKIGNTELVLGDLGKGEYDVKSENGSLTLTENVQDKHYDLNTALLMIISEMACLAAIITALYFFRALMKQFMVCETPFSEGVVKKMRAFAVALIPCMIAYHAASAVKNHVLGNDGSLSFFLSVIFVLVIYVLTMIFKYGAELQKEHDDTV